jgi:hypothetical protein
MELRTYKGFEMQKVGTSLYVQDKRVGSSWSEAKRYIDALPRCPVCATVFSRVTHVCRIDGDYDPTVRE